jgi:outer membrane lipoprotein-sorting protein
VFGAAQEGNSEESLQWVETYLNEINSYEADFIQTDSFGNRVTGHILIHRPGMLRMESDTHHITINGNKLTIYDLGLNEKTETTAHSIPLAFLLRRKIDIHKNCRVLSTRTGTDFVAIKLCGKNEDLSEAIMLVFSRKPFVLRKWIIFPDKNNDSLDSSIEVALFNWKLNGTEKVDALPK